MIVSNIINSLAKFHKNHSPKDEVYLLLQKISQEVINSSDLGYESGSIFIENIGEIKFPFRKMGAINTLHLFGLDELIIFSYYLKSRDKYKNVADIGANLGLHSIVMSKCGYIVNAYEPDPNHVKILRENLEFNKISNVVINEQAVSTKKGKSNFTRVLGNTTSSHLTGDKNPYGDLEMFEVSTTHIKAIMTTNEFIKMDVEGHEANIIEGTSEEDWENTEMILEIGAEDSAKRIYDHSLNLGLNIFAQKTGWKISKNVNELPISYKEGSAFITKKKTMDWYD